MDNEIVTCDVCGLTCTFGEVIILGKFIGICDFCGKKHTFERIYATYQGDYFDSNNTKVHLFGVAPYSCIGCAKITISHNSYCCPPEIAIQSYDEATKGE